MVSKTVREDGTWYECEDCGLMFETREDAREHEKHCDGEEDEPSYIQ
jgi:hypothetical protein